MTKVKQSSQNSLNDQKYFTMDIQIIQMTKKNSLNYSSNEQKIVQMSKKIVQMNKKIVQMNKKIVQMNTVLSVPVIHYTYTCNVSWHFRPCNINKNIYKILDPAEV